MISFPEIFFLNILCVFLLILVLDLNLTGNGFDHDHKCSRQGLFFAWHVTVGKVQV